MEMINTVITYAGIGFVIWEGIKFLFVKFGIGAKIVFSKNLGAIKYIEANPTPELRKYFNSTEQCQLFSAWLLTNGGILVPKERRDRCAQILAIAVQYMGERDSRTTVQPFSTYFYEKTKA
ncbi:hypothetical protein VPHK479_0084 [Vibrio phage K479]